jgi:EpsD family peptidyl-prolyl cis-trans isomerase
MKSFHIPTRACLLGALLSLGLLALAGCGNKNAPKPSTQVAAQVGSEEISLHQINAALAQGSSRGTTPEQVQVLSRTALEGLIDQQVAVDQAMEAKLNRDPDVIGQIEAARRAVLANAYVKQFVGGLPKPDEKDAKQYFAEHPALFAERRIYSVQEIVAPRSPEVLEQFNTMAAANQSMEAVAAWLTARKIRFSPANASRAAEQIPLDLLPRMHTLKDGQDLAFSTPATVSILRLVSSRTEPVTEAVALPRIAQFLGTQRTVDAVTAQIKTLRSKTKVVYLGEFSKPLPEASLAEPPVPVAAAAIPTPGAAAGSVSSTLEKGVAGLK